MQQTLLKRLSTKLTSLEATRARMEALFTAQALRHREMEVLYGGMFLTAATSFESFLEDLFFAILLRRTSFSPARPNKVRALTPRVSEAALRLLLLGERNYLDWLPYDRTEKRAQKLLFDGHPFTEVDQADRQAINHMVLIRHAIAHSGDYARDTFVRKVLSGVSLPPGERNPSGYLRSIGRTSPSYSRFQIHVSEMIRIAQKLTT